MEESVFSDFQVALRALRRRWYVAVAVALLTFGAGAYKVLGMPMVYESQALLRYRPAYRSAKVPAGFFPQELADVSALREEVLNRPSLEELLATLPPPKKEKPLAEWQKILGMTPEPRTDGVKRSIEIYSVRSNIENNLVRVSCRSLNAQMAADIVRWLTDQFIAKHQEQVRRYVSEGQTRLASRRANVMSERSAAQKALSELYSKRQINPAQLGLLDRDLNTLRPRFEAASAAARRQSEELEQIEAQLVPLINAAKAAYKEFRRRQASSPKPRGNPADDEEEAWRLELEAWKAEVAKLRKELMESLPEARAFKSLEEELARARLELEKLLARYTPGHPSVVLQEGVVSRLEEAVAKKQEALDAQISGLIAIARPKPTRAAVVKPGPVVEPPPDLLETIPVWLLPGVPPEIEKAGIELEGKKNGLAGTLRQRQLESERLEGEIKTLEDLRLSLVFKLEKAKPAQDRLKKAEQDYLEINSELEFLSEILPASSAGLASRFEVVEPAIVARYPLKSNRLRNLFVVFVLAMGAAVGAAIFLDQLSAEGREDKAGSKGEGRRAAELEGLLREERARFARELAEARAAAAEARAAAAALQLSAELSSPTPAPEAEPDEELMPGLKEFAAEYGVSGREPLRLLGLLVKSQGLTLSVRELSGALGVSERLARTVLGQLVKARVVRRVRGAAEGGEGYSLSSSPKTRSRLAALQREDRNGRA